VQHIARRGVSVAGVERMQGLRTTAKMAVVLTGGTSMLRIPALQEFVAHFRRNLLARV